MIVQRKVPRPFSLHWGSGVIAEEASIQADHHEPTMQLLEFEDGELAIRFCSYNGRSFSRMPLIVDEDLLPELRKAVAANPRLKKLLKKLVA